MRLRPIDFIRSTYSTDAPVWQVLDEDGYDLPSDWCLRSARLTLNETTVVTVTIFDAGGSQLHRFIENEQWMPGTHTLRLPLNGFAA